MQPDDEVFPIVAAAEGGISDDGLAVLVKLSTLEHGLVHFGLRPADIEGFITFLLHLAAHDGLAAQTPERSQCQPIPISEVSASELEDGSSCLGMKIGGTELLFAIPAHALSELAHTLLAMGTPPDRRRMM